MFMLVITVDLVLLLLFQAVSLLCAIAIFSYLLSRVSPLLALFFFFHSHSSGAQVCSSLCRRMCVGSVCMCEKTKRGWLPVCFGCLNSVLFYFHFTQRCVHYFAYINLTNVKQYPSIQVCYSWVKKSPVNLYLSVVISKCLLFIHSFISQTLLSSLLGPGPL